MNEITKENYLEKLFIDESKPALGRHSGGGGSAPTGPTDNRTNLAFWYQYLMDSITVGFDYDNYLSYLESEPLEELEYPKGTQNVTSFLKALHIACFNMYNAMFEEFPVPVKKMTGELDVASATSLSDLFYNNAIIEDAGRIINTNKVSNFDRMFCGCKSLKSIPEMDTSSATSLYYMFGGCSSLESAKVFIPSRATVTYLFANCPKLRDVELIVNGEVELGRPFSGSESVTNLTIVGSMKPISYTYYNFQDCVNLTHDSLMSVINALLDVGDTTKTLTLGSANLAKLSDEDKRIAEQKGWTLK